MASPIEHWFRIADEDRDGGVGGGEAVRFFTKSGLPQDVLGQIWEYASGGGARLNLAQFGIAMRLVALAQVSGGRLMPDQARVVAMGGGPQLPPPRLAGVTDAPTPSIQTYTPQITGLSTPPAPGTVGYTPQPTGGYMPQVTGGYQPQMTGSVRPQSPYPPTQPGPGAYSAQPTGYGGAGSTGGMPPVSAAAAGMTGNMPAAASAGMTGSFGGGGLPGFPPVSPADMQRYQAAFMATDTDRDGLAKGSECFPMFIKSGLDKALLKRMWDLVAGNAGSLNQEQFVKCMYLMDGCRRGAALPAVLPPGPWPQVTMAGPTGVSMPMPAPPAAVSAGITGPPPPRQQQQLGMAPASTGSMTLQQQAAAGLTGPLQPAAAAAAAATSGLTGGGLPPAPRVSSGAGSAPVSASGLTPLGQAVAAYMQPGGPAALRAESWTLDSQFGQKGAVKAISEAYDQTLPKIPELPGKVTFDAKQAAAATGPSSVPDLDATIASMLAPADKERWEAERSQAQQKEEEQRKAEADIAAAKARLETFQAALSELIMFKSRVDVALLQATDSAARLAAEAEETEIRYNRARLAAQSQAEEGNAARQKLQALLARKQEAANKLELLQQEISMMANLNPAELAALEKDVGALVAQMAAAEAKKAAMEMQLDSGKKQKSLLTERMSDLELAAAAGEGDVRRARQELEELEAKLAAAQAVAQGSSGLGDVGPLLSKAASAYRRLYSSAAAAGLEVPYEANLNNVGSLVWLEQIMAGTADWVDDDSAVSGYSIVNALPDLEGVPPALLRAAAVAATQQPPLKPAAAAAAAATEGDAAANPATAAAVEMSLKDQSQAPVDGPKKAEEPSAAATASTTDAVAEKEIVKAAATALAAAAAAGTAAAAATGSDEVTEKSTAVEARTADTAAAAETVQAAITGSVEAAPVEAAPAATDVAASPAQAAEITVAGTNDASANASDDDAFWDSSVDPTAATAEQSKSEAATVETETVQLLGDAAAAEAAAELPDSAVSAEPSALAFPAAVEPVESSAVDTAAATEAVLGIMGIAPPERQLADEDDSDITSPMGAGLMSAVPAAAQHDGVSVPVLHGLAGFDPAMYRLDSDQQRLGTQYSLDSSYAGSTIGGAAAGATGASLNGLGDDSSSSGQFTGEGHGTGKGFMGFEDNAF